MINVKAPGTSPTYHQNCDYCGGYDEGSKSGLSASSMGAAIRIEALDYNGNPEDVLHVCPRCFIRVFDTVLGARKK
jgi:hypothetical protein